MKNAAAGGLAALVATDTDAARAELRPYLDAPFADVLLDAAVPALRERLVRLAERALLVELHAAELRGQLGDGDEGERWSAFVERLTLPAARAKVLAEYPLLAEAIPRTCAQWVRSCREVAERLIADAPLLERKFGWQGPAASFAVADSDPHHDGRGVFIVVDAAGLRIVYKPRSLAADAELHRLVAELDAAGLEPALRAARAVDRGAYGWMEFVEAGSCADDAAVGRYAARLGAWLAVLYALAATDVHVENLVASGEHPVPIDNETLLHARVYDPPRPTVDDLLDQRIGESVHGVGILPSPTWHVDSRELVDLGGAAEGFDELAHIRAARVVDAGTPAARYALADVPAPRAANRVRRADGSAVDLRLQVDAFERGFEAAYRLLLRERPALLASDGALARFASVRVRLLVRPTSWYARQLDDLAHPHALASRAQHDAQLDLLAARLDLQRWREPFIDSERAQLERGDVPYFEVGAGDALVRGGDGTRITPARCTPGVDVARARIEAMGDDDLAHQLWVIRASFATKRAGAPLASIPMAGTGPLELADAVGRRLAVTALLHDGRAGWLGLSLVGERNGIERYRIEPVGNDAYDGLPGVAWFLAQLAEHTGDDAHRTLGEAAIRSWLDRADRVAGPSVGAMSGHGGTAWMLAALARAWDRPDLADEARRAAQRVAVHASSDAWLDVVSGAAGGVLATLAAGSCLDDGDDVWLDTARACGERLLVAAAREWHGMSITLGLSHGLSGISFALARLAVATGDARYAEGARQAVRAERAQMAGGRWSDNDTDDHVQSTWCHGSPGIAIARMGAHAALGDDDLHDDAIAALAQLVGAPLLPDDGLCHGRLGNLDVLLLARHHYPDDARWRTAADRAAATILDDIRSRGVRTSTARGLETPGLMTGLAGIGHGLLRLDAPMEVPSFLAVDCRDGRSGA